MARRDILVLFLILEGMFHLFTVETDVNCALMYMVLMLRYVSSIPTFTHGFITNGCWSLSKAFSAFTEMVIWLWFDLLLWCITRTVDTEPSFIPRIKLTWSWCVVLLMSSWISLVIHWGVASVFISGTGLQLSCFCDLSGFGHRVMLASEWVQKCSYLCSFCGMVSVGSVLTLL